MHFAKSSAGKKYWNPWAVICELIKLSCQASKDHPRISCFQWKNVPWYVIILKGLLILKCSFRVFKSPENQRIFFQDFCTSSKKRSNQNNKGTFYPWLEDFILTLLHHFFDLTSFYRLRQEYKNIFVSFLVQMKTLKSFLRDLLIFRWFRKWQFSLKYLMDWKFPYIVR